MRARRALQSRDNGAEYGGGIYAAGFSPFLYVVDSTVSGNFADADGGGLYLRAGGRWQFGGGEQRLAGDTGDCAGDDAGR